MYKLSSRNIKINRKAGEPFDVWNNYDHTR